MTKLLSVLYQLSMRVELQPSPHAKVKIPRVVGLRGEYDCATCDDARKAERGGCPYLDNPQPGTVPCVIGDSGNEEEDLLWECPMGLSIREPVARETIRLYHEVSGLGGAAAYYGSPLHRLPPRVTRALSVLSGIEAQMQARVRQTRAEMDR